MKRTSWSELSPSLLVGAGILLSTFIAVHTRTGGWTNLAAPLVMALALVGGVWLDRTLREKRTSPKLWVALVTACAMFLVAAFIVTMGGGQLARVFLPSTAAAMWVALLSGSRGRRNRCEAV